MTTTAMWYAHKYTPKRDLNDNWTPPATQIALSVLATYIHQNPPRNGQFAIFPTDGGFPSDDEESKERDGRLRYWPKVATLGRDLFFNEHEVYSLYMRQAGHREDEMRNALSVYQQQREGWRRKWMEAIGKSAAEADRHESGLRP